MAACGRGQRLSLGTAPSRDDWRCVGCRVGQYQGVHNTIQWAEATAGMKVVGGTVDAAEQPWVTNTAVLSCLAKEVLACTEPGTVFSKGSSATGNDWVSS